MKINIIYLLLLPMFFSCKNTKEAVSENAVNYRPAYHYSPEKNWVNDPNGLVYLDGEYHLFYQYNPFGDKWGHMSWGHAVSTDLQNWEELPVALPEIINDDGTKEGIFSGSAVVDSLNTSGFFEPEFKHGLVAIFTANITKGEEQLSQNQSIAYSSDKGRTWKYYDQNPVLDIGLKDFRDPNVMWWPSEQKWIMTVVKPLEYIAQFYESKDLKNWTLMSEFGKMGDTTKIWECPALVKVPVEKSEEGKWVLIISSGYKTEGFVGMQYFVGDFDGHSFTPQKATGVLSLDHGKDFYAAIPFNGLPNEHKKPLIIGWINNWTYAGDIPLQGSRGTFSMARQLSLTEVEGSYVLVQTPVVSDAILQENLNLTAADFSNNKVLEMPTNSYGLNLAIDLKNLDSFKISLLKNENEECLLSYHKESEQLTFDRTKSGKVDFQADFPSIEQMTVTPNNGKLTLSIFVDNSVIEIYGDGGKKVMTELVFPTKSSGKILFSK